MLDRHPEPGFAFGQNSSFTPQTGYIKWGIKWGQTP